MATSPFHRACNPAEFRAGGLLVSCLSTAAPSAGVAAVCPPLLASALSFETKTPSPRLLLFPLLHAFLAFIFRALEGFGLAAFFRRRSFLRFLALAFDLF